MAAFAFGELGHATRRILCFSVSLGLFTPDIGQAVGEVELVHFQDQVQTLRERVTELAGKENLLDTLYYGWSDRPYARATLAILIKVAATLDREVDYRGHGNGKIDDAKVESMLQWADEAIRRVVRAEPSDEFRPHRIESTWKQLFEGKGAPPLIGFLDGIRLTPQHPGVGDLDVLASVGQRFYARPLGSRLDGQDSETTAQRAEALGMTVFDITPWVDQSAWKCDNHWDLIRPLWRDRGRYIAYTGPATLFLLKANESRGLSLLPAVEDTKEGESLGASLARRAMLRGVMATATYAAYRWTPPIMEAAPQHAHAALAATLWVQALEGQRLALVDGWRDAYDENDPQAACVFLNPARVETIAHTALDFLHYAELIRAFDDISLAAIAVSEDAFTHETDNPNGAVGWSDWTEPIWTGLLSRQTRFDVVRWEPPEEKPKPPYRWVFRLEQASRPTGGSTLERIERGLAQLRDHVYRLTAREMDGTIAADVYVRVGRTPEAKACAAVVNLSDRPRVLKLRGRPAIGASRDVITNQQISEPDQRLEFAPWQVRLLWPRE